MGKNKGGWRAYLKKLKKEYYSFGEFDPSVFDQPPFADTTSITYWDPPSPGPFALPPLTKKLVKITQKQPARPRGSDVAPTRIRTRPVPVRYQIKPLQAPPTRSRCRIIQNEPLRGTVHLLFSPTGYTVAHKPSPERQGWKLCTVKIGSKMNKMYIS